MDAENNMMTLSANVTYVPDATVSLCSVPEACKQGHHVHFEGSPYGGLHRMYAIETGEWISFTWDETTGLWWICIHPAKLANYGSRHEMEEGDIPRGPRGGYE